MSTPALRVVPESGPGPDLEAAEAAAADLLTALGISLDSESLRGTPGRMARAYAELFTPRAFDLTTFPNDEGYDELVLARGIPVRSVCEHHLLLASLDSPRIRSSASRTSVTCPANGSSDCPSWPGSSSTSPAARRFRSGSRNRSPTGSTSSSNRAESAW